jgi:hypothetical protein
MAGDREKILRKLKALRGHAASAKKLGSEAEASAFAEMIQRLTAQHCVEAAELDAIEQDEVDPFDRIRPDYAKHGVRIRARHVEWLEELASTVAHAHYCKLLVKRNSSLVTFAGRRSQASVAADVYLKMASLAESLADKRYVDYFYEVKRAGDVAKARGFRTSFLLGFCARVGGRYFEFIEATKAYYAHDKRALATLSSARDKVRDWLEKDGVGTSAARYKKVAASNFDGWRRGVDEANEVDLSGRQKID